MGLIGSGCIGADASITVKTLSSSGITLRSQMLTLYIMYKTVGGIDLDESCVLNHE